MTDLTWARLVFPQSFPLERAIESLQRIAADASTGTIVCEARIGDGQMQFLLGATTRALAPVTNALSALVPGLMVAAAPLRESVRTSLALKASTSTPNASPDEVTAGARSLMAALLSQTDADTSLVVFQVMLGERLSPQTFQPPLAAFTVTSKAPTSYGFRVGVRLGFSADAPQQVAATITAVKAAIRLTQTDGGLSFVPEDPRALIEVRRPRYAPLRLDTMTVAGLVGWPVGDPVQGMPSVHPRPLAPKVPLAATARAFAVTSAPGFEQRIGIPAADSLTHTQCLGPTGVGKSNSILHLALDDADAGHGLLLLDAKSDLITAILERLPAHRLDDVAVIDPADTLALVGIDAFRGAQADPWLAADSLLACFRQVWADNWGVRTEEVLSAALLTLARTPGATLLWIPQLLTDDDFRREVLARLEPDPLGIDLFWARYEATPPGPRATLIGPTMTKLQELLIRPSLRSVFGQAEPKLDLADIFDGKIVLVDLNKGRLGDSVSRLLGSIIIGTLWPLVLARADVPPEQRGITQLYIDEVQDYLTMPGNLSSALAQARGLGVGITASHQYRGQLSDDMLSAFDANMRSKVYWGLQDPDATTIASRTEALDAEDLRALPRFHVYANVMQHGEATGWISGRTLPPPPKLRDADVARSASRRRYGIPAADIEREVMRTLRIGTRAREPAVAGA